MKGLVIKNTGSWYTVLTDDGQLLDCKIKGNFRLKGIRSTNPVAVGDRVTVLENFITEIEDRRNYIIRRASNLSKEFQIMELLARDPGRAVSTDEFCKRIWGWEESPDMSVVRVHISSLRKKLAEVSAGVVIHGERGVGYSLQDAP